MKDEQIIKLYQQGESALTIQKKYGTCYKTVYRSLERNGIKRRNDREKTLNAIKQGRSSNSELQRKVTSEKWKGENNPRWKLGRSKCEVCGNEGHAGKSEYGKMLCLKHYRQMREYGKILERTRFDKNEIIDCGEYCEICIYSGLGEQIEIVRAKIDKDDLEKVKQYKWCLSGKYIVTRYKNKQLRLHQLIMGIKKGFDIDHRNHDKLDNRKQNLRHCTRSQNLMNKMNVRGITWDKNRSKWIAQINVNYKHIYLGRFEKEEDALKARKQAEIKYFREFAFNDNLINI